MSLCLVETYPTYIVGFCYGSHTCMRKNTYLVRGVVDWIMNENGFRKLSFVTSEVLA